MGESFEALGGVAVYRMTVLAMALMLVQGCGPSIPSNPATYPVRGKVTLDGQPLKRGFVRFDPVSPGKGLAAEGEIQSDGRYEARVFVGQQGTTPGEYKVSIAPLSRQQEGDLVAEALDVPAKYQKPETSDITKTVTSGENSIDIELTSK